MPFLSNNSCAVCQVGLSSSDLGGRKRIEKGVPGGHTPGSKSPANSKCCGPLHFFPEPAVGGLGPFLLSVSVAGHPWYRRRQNLPA